MLAKIVLAGLVAVTAGIPTGRLSEKEAVETAFNAWKIQFNKTYESVEEHMNRMIVFAENAAFVKMHNAEGHPWTVALNEFADLTNEEFTMRHQLMDSLIGTENSPATGRHVNTGAAPASVDWRDEGLVGPVKNQAQCGSCWAFSTVVSLEGQVAKKENKYTSLSEQALVDCVKNVKLPGQQQECCMGCQGGLMDYAFQWMISNEGGKDDTESAYPYKAVSGTCSFETSSTSGVGITGFKDIAKGDENSLKDAVGTVGPVSVAVNAGGLGWQLYHGGVYTPWFCSGDRLDHGVALVGYGTDSGKDYWIIRNSWGASWGEQGYMRMALGKNACGVANQASYPTI